MPFGDVRRRLGAVCKSFKRTSSSAFPCDYFPSLGIFACYTVSGELEAVELASPADPQLDGIQLLTLGFDAAKDFLQSKDSGLEVEVDGAIARAIGISLYAPKAKEDSSAPCESVLVFQEGYF